MKERDGHRIRAAAVQLNATADRDRNVETAERLVRAAAADGAELIVLPEKWTVLGDVEALQAGAETIDGPSLAAVGAWAAELGIHIVAGSISERVDGSERLFNTSAVIDREGNVVAVYRKIHLFDVDVGGVSYRESDAEAAGEEIIAADLHLDGGRDLRLGLSVCYDLRFPELYRILAVGGARVLAVPAAFTAETGRAHWETLLRARAIENQCFVIAAGQVGQAPPHFDSWGHSMIVDAWGEVLAVAAGEEGFAVADLDLERQDEIRSSLPSLANRVAAAYRWPDSVQMAMAGGPA